jgi:hypothetical protein
MFRSVVPESVTQFGKTKNHLEIKFKNIKAIGFFMTASDWQEKIGSDVLPGEPITLIAHFEKSVFRGKTELRLRIVDIEKFATITE